LRKSRLGKNEWTDKQVANIIKYYQQNTCLFDPSDMRL